LATISAQVPRQPTYSYGKSQETIDKISAMRCL
jgi:hypothetical protein